MSFDPNDYNITVRRVAIDDEILFEARVLELPDVRAYAASAADAHAKTVEAIEALQELAAQDQDEFPAPIEPESEYSGRVTLRLAKSQHRAVALRALQEDVSINTYIANAVAAALSANPVVATLAAVSTQQVTNLAWNRFFHGTTGVAPRFTPQGWLGAEDDGTHDIRNLPYVSVNGTMVKIPDFNVSVEAIIGIPAPHRTERARRRA